LNVDEDDWREPLSYIHESAGVILDNAAEEVTTTEPWDEPPRGAAYSDFDAEYYRQTNGKFLRVPLGEQPPSRDVPGTIELTFT
jgi:hypothetical protein